MWVTDEFAAAVKKRYGETNNKETLAYEPPDSEHILACERAPFTVVQHLLPDRYLAQMRANAPNTCCHDPSNLDIEAWFSKPIEKQNGAPDLYKIYCNVCMDCHARLCGGLLYHPKNPELNDYRPSWVLTHAA
jgi:hypothetical protein